MDRAENRLALIELLGEDGRVQRTVDVHAWPVSLGRGLANTVVLDDAHVAAQQALIDWDEASATALLQVLPGLNPVRADGQVIAATRPLHSGVQLSLGRSQLRLRLRDEALPAECLLAGPATAIAAASADLAAAPAHAGAASASIAPAGVQHHRVHLLMALALFAVVLLSHWIGLDPGANFEAWVPVLLGLPFALVAWATLWALLSKLFQQRFDFRGHLTLALPWLLGWELIDIGWTQLATSLGAASMWRLSGLITAVLAAGWLVQHLRLVLPRHGRGIQVAMASGLLVWAGMTWTSHERRFDQWHSAPYMPSLPMPALRWHTAAPPETLVEAMRPMQARLQQRVQQAQRDEPQDGDTAD